MITYAFILGRKHLLSIAELCAVIPTQAHIIDIRKEALIASLPEPLSQPQDSLNRLGGTMKIAEVFAEVPLKANQVNPALITSSTEVISAHLLNKFKDRESKLSYGLSVYSFAGGHDELIKKTLMGVKKELKSAGLKPRFINHDFKNLENAAIKGEKLIEQGAEILIIQGNHKLFFAETKALQDFENYSHRDYDRPERDAKLGMLPPKLAQIMINLAGLTRLDQPVQSAQTIYDPFAGIGTIQMEALLFGYSVVASDINPEIIQKAEKNTTWLKSQTASPTNGKAISPAQTTKFFAQDATALTFQDLPTSPSAVVTETYLGPPRKTVPDPDNIRKNFAHIRELLYRFFKVLYPLLQAQTPVVLTLPVYREKNLLHFIEDLIPTIEQLGYHIEPLISKEMRAKFDLISYKREGLVYDRPDQIVGREVWKLTKR